MDGLDSRDDAEFAKAGNVNRISNAVTTPLPMVSTASSSCSFSAAFAESALGVRSKPGIGLW